MTTELPAGGGTAAGAEGTPGPPPQPRSRRRRRVRPAAAAVAVAATTAGGWWLVTTAGAGTQAAPTAPRPPATAVVGRQDLVETQQVSGTLGYGDEHQVSSSLRGVVTWLAAEASTVSRGKALYRVDDRPVVLLYGTMPLYRRLAPGDEGPDVKELEANLAALGYTGFSVDDQYTADTADAVREWQADLGLAETGAVEAGRVVVAPDAIRIGNAKTTVGARTGPGRPVLAYTATVRVVSVDLDVDDQRLARKGGKVSVVMPDGPRLRGTVASVGAVAQVAPNAQAAGAGGGGTSSGDDATIEVTITLDDPKRTGTLDQAPVDVEFVSEQRKAVLTVPVTALLALRDGGYGVEVIDGDGTRIVAVEVGIFANGRVEVTGTGIAAGMKVGVPS